MRLPWRRDDGVAAGPLARLRALDEPLSRTEAAKARRAEVKRRRRRRLLVVNAGGLAVTTVLVVVAFVFPTRSLLAHRDALRTRQRDLEQLSADNAVLANRISLLQTPAEIERIAREEYGYIQPGEQAYVILAGPPPELPGTWPYPLVAQLLESHPA